MATARTKHRHASGFQRLIRWRCSSVLHLSCRAILVSVCARCLYVERNSLKRQRAGGGEDVAKKKKKKKLFLRHPQPVRRQFFP